MTNTAPNHSTYASCITGRPQRRVLIHGQPLTRFDSIVHRDGSIWRYEGLGNSNSKVLASGPGEHVHRFELGDFGIRVESVSDRHTSSREIA